MLRAAHRPSPLPPSTASSAPHLNEDLLTPRFYTTQIRKAARTDIAPQGEVFAALVQEMENDYNRDHFDRKAPLDRLQALSPREKEAYESYCEG